MKKIYVSPEIVYEDFSLSTNIAGDCESIVGNPAKGTCSLPTSDPDTNIFSTGINGCDTYPEDLGFGTDTYDGFCYHVPSQNYSLFNS